MSHPIRILIADDHPMVRQALCEICDAEPDLHVIGQAGDGHEAYRMALLLQPDVVLMDLAMPLLDGVQATRHLRDDTSAVAVIILTVCHQEPYVLQALKAGVRAYLLKDADSDTLLQTIRRVATGEVVVNPLLARTILDEYRHQQSDPRVSNGLTHLPGSDQELLALTIQGMPAPQIGKRLGLTEGNIRQRLSLIAAKLYEHEAAGVRG